MIVVVPKLSGRGDWSWWWVLAPVWAWLLIGGAVWLLSVVRPPGRRRGRKP